ncbi:MAG: hypothetical protein JOY99_01620 [Sphingomonadaceae bacterium]|nr:hypothetical protein [Sphingomonadaceae bacterium]
MAMIDRMDEMDGDCDIEDDDPAGDPLDAGEFEAGSHPNDVLVKTRPIYGVDQSLGPINQDDAWQEHRRNIMKQAE